MRLSTEGAIIAQRHWQKPVGDPLNTAG